MRYYSFKLYPEDDPELIEWLNSIIRKKRSEEIRKALRAYFRGQSGAGKVNLPSIPDRIPKTNGTVVTEKLYRRD